LLALPAEAVYVPRMPPSALMTADDLLRVYIPDKQFELVRGVPGRSSARGRRRAAGVCMPARNDSL